MRKLFFSCLILTIAFACKKKDDTGCSASQCAAISAMPPLLFFNYYDTLNSRYPFWTAPRQYQFSDLKVYKLRGPMDTVFLPVTLDSVTSPARFYIAPNQLTDTIYMRILSEKVDTFHITAGPVRNDCCVVGYNYSSVKVNGKVSCVVCALTNVVDIRR